MCSMLLKLTKIDTANLSIEYQMTDLTLELSQLVSGEMVSPNNLKFIMNKPQTRRYKYIENQVNELEVYTFYPKKNHESDMTVSGIDSYKLFLGQAKLWRGIVPDLHIIDLYIKQKEQHALAATQLGAETSRFGFVLIRRLKKKDFSYLFFKLVN
jgi:hypothetical protein